MGVRTNSGFNPTVIPSQTLGNNKRLRGAPANVCTLPLLDCRRLSFSLFQHSPDETWTNGQIFTTDECENHKNIHFFPHLDYVPCHNIRNNYVLFSCIIFLSFVLNILKKTARENEQTNKQKQRRERAPIRGVTKYGIRFCPRNIKRKEFSNWF